MNLRKAFIVIAGMLVVSVAIASQEMSVEDIKARIMPVGHVAISGAAAAVDTSPRSGAEIYQQACFACHATGALNAPKLGDVAAWEPRIAQGFDVMLEHAIKGFNGMPPMGTCGDCSDDDIKIAIEHMIEGI